MNVPAPRWTSCVAVAFCALFTLLVFAKAMFGGVNHDEHQFVAPASLLWQSVPYRDFPLFHLPTLLLINAALAGVFGHPFLCARIFNALCAASAVCLIFLHARNAFAARGRPFALLLGAAAAAVLMFSPLFADTSGKAWNHDFPMLLTVAAFLLQIAAAKKSSPAWWMAGSGLCIGLAVGARLTYAPLAAPLFAANFLLPFPRRQQFALAGIFAAAAAAALLPVAWCFATAPEHFLFCNFEFPRLRLLDPSDERAQKTVKLWRKLRFLAKEIAPSNPAIFALFLSGLPGWWRGWKERSFESRLLLLVLPFALAGCLAPTRYQSQHFYILAPLLVLAGAHGLALFQEKKVAHVALLVFALIAVCLGARDYRDIAKIARINEWTPLRARAAGLKIKELAPSGKVMTLAPIAPVEAGLQIYPEFATGPFAMRLAHLVSAERRRAMHLVAREEIALFLESDPPAAILLGSEARELEAPLLDYARAHRFQLIRWKKNQEIWIAPR